MNKYDKIPISLFGDVQQNLTNEVDHLSFEEIVDFLQESSLAPYQSKEQAPLMASCEFRDGKRRKANVERSGLVMLDIDEEKVIDEVEDLFSELGVATFIYTTASHRPDHHKFRVGIPLSANVDGETYTRAWCALNHLVDDVVDRSKRGAESLFYLPGDYPGTDGRFIVMNGEIIPAEVWIESVGLPEDDVAFAAPIAGLSSRSPSRTPSPRLTRLRDALNDGDRRVSLYDSKLVSERAKCAYLDTADNWHHARYRFMCSVSARAQKLGTNVAPEEIREIFNQLDLTDGGHYQGAADQKALLGDAMGALRFAGLSEE